MNYTLLKDEFDLRMYRAYSKYRDAHNDLSASINKAREEMFDEQKAAEKDFIIKLKALDNAS